MIVSFC